MSKIYAGLAFIRDGSMDFEEILLYFSDNPYTNSVLISETVFKNKMKRGEDMSKIINQVMVDLRSFSPEALSKIEEISNVVDIILPKNMSVEFADAYGKIKKSRVVNELKLTDDQKLTTVNGTVTITENDVSKNSFLKANGVLIVKGITEAFNLNILVNGLLVKTKSSKINIEKLNGLKIEIDDDASIITSMKNIEIDKCFIDSINDKTVIIDSDEIIIKDDVTADMLRSKSVYFADIKQIYAPKSLHGYIHANSVDISRISESKKRKFSGLFARG